MSYKPFTAIMERYFKRTGGLVRLKGELAVYYWPKVAGRELAAKIEAVRYQDGNLWLRTENPALAHQVTLMSLEILKRFQKLLGRNIIKNIKVRIAPLCEPPRPPAPQPCPVELSPDDEKFIAECGQEIPDPEIEARFAAVMRKHLKNTKQQELLYRSRCKCCGVPVPKSDDLCACCQFHRG
ncbi:uncharacterized protein DUF721 [Hydrogenispora ethanolica]|jgi:hypothetical protein|uniref:Uncharacterized protein DUF721 n=1 Tax=Hydrogenispora ethanolica TaxID=1082276 RepID=A0A4R1SA17_HYDET|nr:DUF721 domain-containing protein [Hydrogenispora ethanolica]TCL76336.1 uncharacterized protein DUF721 [Hydrogenispora ethanolica]